MPISEDQIARVDQFHMNDTKVLDAYQPHWTRAPGYGDYQMAWPILEEDTGKTSAHLRFRLPEQDFRYPSISLILSAALVSRFDNVAPDVCKPNPPWAARYGLPAEACGTHVHSWHDNRQHVLTSGEWQLPARRPVEGDFSDLDAMFFWFCGHLNVRIKPHNRPIRLPDVGLFGRHANA